MFSAGVLMLIGVIGFVSAVGVLFVFLWQLDHGVALLRAQTVAFTLLVMFELFNAFNARSERLSIFRAGPLRNRWLVLAVLSSLVLQLVVVYWPPLQQLFKTTPLGPEDWLMIVPIASLALISAELGKLVLSRQRQVVERRVD